MASNIINVVGRGQITLPKEVRKALPTKYFTYTLSEQDGEQVVTLKALHTREDFFAQLDAAEKEWEKSGGLTLGQMKEKYNI